MGDFKTPREWIGLIRSMTAVPRRPVTAITAAVEAGAEAEIRVNQATILPVWGRLIRKGHRHTV